MQKILIISGCLILLAGLLWPWLSKLPIGRLPGDIAIQRDGLRVYIPLATSLLISLLLSAILWLARRWQ